MAVVPDEIERPGGAVGMDRDRRCAHRIDRTPFGDDWARWPTRAPPALYPLLPRRGPKLSIPSRMRTRVPATMSHASSRSTGPSGCRLLWRRERAAGTGANELEPAKRTALPELLFEAATEPFVLLLIAAGVLAVLLGELRDGLLILLALIPIVAADVITEYRGERALEALREASAPTARVRRDAVVTEAPAASLVPGDIVLLRGGDIVPADLRLLRTDRIVIDRSVLTGESVPEPATAEADRVDAPLASRRAMAYAGTSVVAGRGEGVVTAVGAGSEVGRIAGGLGSRERRRSPLQTRARSTGSDPAGRGDRSHRDRHRSRVRPRPTGGCRTSWLVYRLRSRPSPRSRRSFWR